MYHDLLFGRFFLSFVLNQVGSEAAVKLPLELSVAPLLLDDEEVAAYAAAESAKPSIALLRQTMPKMSYLKLKQQLDTVHHIEVWVL
jgi:hypothetical protein